MILFYCISFAFSLNIPFALSQNYSVCGGSAEADVYCIDPISAWNSCTHMARFEICSLVWECIVIDCIGPKPFYVPGNIKSCSHPLVLTLILEAKTLCPASLIPILSCKFKEIDGSSTQAKACTSLCPIIEFLWAASKKLVPPSVVALDTSADGLDWSAQLHFACIKPLQLIPAPPLFPVPPPPSLQSNTNYNLPMIR